MLKILCEGLLHFLVVYSLDETTIGFPGDPGERRQSAAPRQGWAAGSVAHYRILEQIGRGGMGLVFRAKDTRLRRTVALKFLSPSLTRNPVAKERFFKEAQAASAPSSVFQLYPYMNGLISLASKEAIIQNAEAIKNRLKLPIADPRHMPVTRDLSANKKQILLNWLNNQAQSGKD